VPLVAATLQVVVPMSLTVGGAPPYSVICVCSRPVGWLGQVASTVYLHESGDTEPLPEHVLPKVPTGGPPSDRSSILEVIGPQFPDFSRNVVSYWPIGTAHGPEGSLLPSASPSSEQATTQRARARVRVRAITPTAITVPEPLARG
jgi:hypothetical protein